jgi:16S rRNA (cytosine967-C5)-methyltransferase
MSPAPGRAAALEAVRRVRERDAFGHEALHGVLAGSELSPRDTAFATRLAYGTMAARGTLDEVLDERLKRPAAVRPRVRDVLRLGTYELLFMRTPGRAVVNESVDAVKQSDPGAAGLVNAVLRRVADCASSFPWGDAEADEAVLARATGTPPWLARLWTEELGRERARIALGSTLEPAPLYLMHNPFRGDLGSVMEALLEDGAEPEACEPHGCVRCGRPGAAVGGDALRTGKAVVTDAAAQLPARVASPLPDTLVLDVAAGRGTKTLGLQAAATAAGGPARILATDRHPFKVAEIARRMSRLDVPGVEAVTVDATDPDALRGALPGSSPAVVLVDAPCSGLGTLRRHPDAVWRTDRSEFAELARLQLALVRAAAEVVSERGAIIYTTCTVSRVENQGVVESFLSEEMGSGFRSARLDGVVGPAWREAFTAEGWIQTIPREGGPDGHFVAKLVREG